MINYSIRVSMKMAVLIKYFTASQVLQTCILKYIKFRKIQIIYVSKSLDQVSNHFGPNETLHISGIKSRTKLPRLLLSVFQCNHCFRKIKERERFECKTVLAPVGSEIDNPELKLKC